MLDKILVARLHAGAPGASPALHAIGRDRRALEIAAVADRYRDLFIGNEVFEMNLCGFVFDSGAPLVAIKLLNRFELFDDYAAKLLSWPENRFELGDVFACKVQFFVDFVD